jgi:hypothetical protein
MKAVKWYCENCGTTVIPGKEIEWDETCCCPGCLQDHMIQEESKSKKTGVKHGNYNRKGK